MTPTAAELREQLAASRAAEEKRRREEEERRLMEEEKRNKELKEKEAELKRMIDRMEQEEREEAARIEREKAEAEEEAERKRLDEIAEAAARLHEERQRRTQSPSQVASGSGEYEFHHVLSSHPFAGTARKPSLPRVPEEPSEAEHTPETSTDTDGEVEGKGKGKGKAKAKKQPKKKRQPKLTMKRNTNRKISLGTVKEVTWRKLEGKERCAECVGKGLEFCVVDDSKISKWEAEVLAGKKFARSPSGAACEECRAKKHKCLLPRTMSLRVQTPADGKRKRDVVNLEGEEGDDEDEDEDEGTDPAPVTKKPRTQGNVARLDETTSLLDVASRLVAVLQQGLQQQREAANTQTRIADAVERIVNALEQDETYVPSREVTESSSSSSDEDTEQLEGVGEPMED